MANFALVQLEPEIHNEHLPGNQASTSQRTLLSEDTEEGELVARIDAYLSNSFYSAYWATVLSEADLVSKFEECLATFENRYSQGVANLTGSPTDPFGGNQPTNNKYFSGLIVLAQHDEKSDKLELDYNRPLSWQQIADIAEDSVVYLVRFNTPIGDFLIQFHDSVRVVGVISHVTDTNPFVDLITTSSSKGISREQAIALFDKSLAGFTKTDTTN